MNFKTIEKDFIDTFSSRIRLVSDGKERFRVFTPFRFDDGDHLRIVLKNENDQWILSDEGHTYMHLTYEIDAKKLHSGKHHKIISSVLSTFELKDRDGELIFEVQDGDYGAALYSFAQSLIRVSDVSYLSLFREQRPRPTFRKDVRVLVEKVVSDVPVWSMRRGWIHPKDVKNRYKVDYKINGQPKPPLLVYALSSDTRTRDATIALHQFKSWDMKFRSLGIMEHSKRATPKVLDCFLDVCDDCSYNLVESHEIIQDYLS